MSTHRLTRSSDLSSDTIAAPTHSGDDDAQGSRTPPTPSSLPSILQLGLSSLFGSGLTFLLLLVLQWTGATNLDTASRGFHPTVLFSSPSPLPHPFTLPPKTFPSSLPCRAEVLRDELHYLTHSEHLELLRAAGLRPSVPQPSYLLVGMSGMVKGKERMRTALDTWLNDDVRSRAIFFSDMDDPALRMVTLPSLRDMWEFRFAQHRQLRGLRWLFNFTTPPALNASQQWETRDVDHLAPVSDPVALALRDEVLRGEVQWVVLVDDDTFVNIPALLSFLRENTAASSLPLFFGNVFDRVTGAKDLAYSAAGSGIIMSVQAARMIARVIWTPVCLDVYLNDDSIGVCAVKLNITNVHTALLQNGLEGMYWKQYELKPFKQTAITWHYINDTLAREIQAEIDRREAVLRRCITTGDIGTASSVVASARRF